MTSTDTVSVAVAHPDDVEGWTSAAIAICSIMQIPAPMLLRLIPEGFEPIYVDFRFRAFVWPHSIASFPAHPAYVDVETESTPINSPPLFELPGQSLDALLWAIGSNAFNGQQASWMNPRETYRLKRWPNLTVLELSADQVRLASLLANGYFTAATLAEAAEVDLETTQRALNALSLMGILVVSTETDDPAVVVAPSPAASVGLLSRLRDRLGL
jgi:hypothetical protein